MSGVLTQVLMLVCKRQSGEDLGMIVSIGIRKLTTDRVPMVGYFIELALSKDTHGFRRSMTVEVEMNIESIRQIGLHRKESRRRGRVDGPIPTEHWLNQISFDRTEVMRHCNTSTVRKKRENIARGLKPMSCKRVRQHSI